MGQVKLAVVNFALVECIITRQSPQCVPLVYEKFAENPEFCVENFAVNLKRELFHAKLKCHENPPLYLFFVLHQGRPEFVGDRIRLNDGGWHSTDRGWRSTDGLRYPCGIWVAKAESSAGCIKCPRRWEISNNIGSSGFKWCWLEIRCTAQSPWN